MAILVLYKGREEHQACFSGSTILAYDALIDMSKKVHNNVKQSQLSTDKCAPFLWAKTDGDNYGAFSPLYVHMSDTGEVARLLWEAWIPESIQQMLTSMTGSGVASESLVIWMAMVHDIGKATPAFQYKVPVFAEHVKEQGLDTLDDPKYVSHAFMGQVILNDWLMSIGWEYGNTYATVVGGHHGAPPTIPELNEITHNIDTYLGDDCWKRIRSDLLQYAYNYSGIDRFQTTLSHIPLSSCLQVLLTGLVIMSDWIASDSEYFPCTDNVSNYANCQIKKTDFKNRAGRAWKFLNLSDAWHPVCVKETNDELFYHRFAITSSPYSAQCEALNLARNIKKPGLMIIEAPMGSGKTETSLLCAEIFASKYHEGGIAYFLPTMATSNAMFTRIENWLKHVPDARGNKQQQTVCLAHSKSRLNKEYASLKSEKKTSGANNFTRTSTALDDTAQLEDIIANPWLCGRKRWLLSSFVVGTVDQLLMAALKTRHVQLRHLGLAGKVVVVDEVHAYDAYMSVYLDRILAWLGTYNVPTIMLSATLPSSRRDQLMRAYRGSTGRTRSADRIQVSPCMNPKSLVYPLVSYCSADRDEAPMYRRCENSGRVQQVMIEYLADDDETLVKMLKNSMSDGGCVCVLRDTVKRAQQTYELLVKTMNIPIKLVHSRFISIDRVANDKELLDMFGPDSECRPKSYIVVGTQVIEQSLDIDFDLLITDIAPVDLLLQRIGRLHRCLRGANQSDRPVKMQKPCCYITGITDWNASPPTIVKEIKKIYQPAIIWETLAALGEQNKCKRFISLPDDIAPLVDCVYEDKCAIPKSWEADVFKAKKTMKNERFKKENKAKTWLLDKPRPEGKDLTNWFQQAFSIDDEQGARATVRDTQPSIEVVLVQEAEGEIQLLPWVEPEKEQRSLGNGMVVPDDDMAKIAASCTVCLPPRLCLCGIADQVIAYLEKQYALPGWQESAWLKGALPLVLDMDCKAKITCSNRTFILTYSVKEGLILGNEDENE